MFFRAICTNLPLSEEVCPQASQSSIFSAQLSHITRPKSWSVRKGFLFYPGLKSLLLCADTEASVGFRANRRSCYLQGRNHIGETI